MNRLFGWEEHQHEERRLKYQSFLFIQTLSGSFKEGESNIEAWSFRLFATNFENMYLYYSAKEVRQSSKEEKNEQTVLVFRRTSVVESTM